MKFSSGPLPARGSGWKARITATAFECETDGRDTRFIFKEITRIDCSTGLVWAAVEICSHSETLRLGSIVNASARLLARTLRERVSKTLLSLLEPHRTACRACGSPIPNSWRHRTISRNLISKSGGAVTVRSIAHPFLPSLTSSNTRCSLIALHRMTWLIER